MTFNYDRSLEASLAMALQNSYGLDSIATEKMLESIPIVHVYGQLGSFRSGAGQPEWREYAPLLNNDTVHLAASGLRVMGEEQGDAEGALEEAATLVREAEVIAFLGFGYHRLNIERIRFTETIRLEPGSTKNDEGRTLPYDLLPEMVDVIERQWEAHESLASEGVICPWVFNRRGRQIKGFVKAWKSACKTAGCPGKLPHDFRRTAIRNLVRSGVPEKTAMTITGHKTRSVFDRYDIIDEADLRNALGTLAGTKKGQSARSGRVVQLHQSSQIAVNKG